MPDFMPAAAAFEGFRFTRERPGAVAAWAGATLGFNLLSGVLGALLGGSAMVEFQALAQEQPIDVGAILRLLPRLLPAFAITVFINLAASAVIYSSAVRSFMGIDHRVTFRIGQDERRILLILLGFGAIYFVVSAVTGVVFGFLVNILIAFVPDLNETVERTIPIASFRAFLYAFLLAIPPTAVIVRLSLAPVIAVDRKRISLKESWVSTKGHFWPLTGSLILSLLLYVVAVFVGLLVVMALAQVLSIPTNGAISPGSLASAEHETLADLIKPAAIFGELITAMIVAMVLPVIFAPLVRAYQAYDEQAYDGSGGPTAYPIPDVYDDPEDLGPPPAHA